MKMESPHRCHRSFLKRKRKSNCMKLHYCGSNYENREKYVDKQGCDQLEKDIKKGVVYRLSDFCTTGTSFGRTTGTTNKWAEARNRG